MTDLRDLLQEGLKHERGGDLDHALECYGRVLEAAEDASLVVSTLIRISHAQRKRSRWKEAASAAHRAAEVARAEDLGDEHALALNAEAAVYHSRGDFEQARLLYGQVLLAAEQPATRGRALQNLGVLAALAGRLEEAEKQFLDASTAFAEAGDSAGEAFVLNNYTALALDRSDPVEAERRALKALEAARRVGDLELMGHARLNYAEALFALNRLDKADTEATAALGFFDASGNTLRRIAALRILGDMSRATGHLEVARRFYERALRDAGEIGAGADREQLEERLRSVEEQERGE